MFISYSRSDQRFASELLAGLAYDGGFETLIDSHSIHEGEEWKARITALILEADTVVVVLSPHWLQSGICKWEMEEAWSRAKRIIPVQPVPLDKLDIPARLAAINFVRFDQGPDGGPRLFMDGLAALRRALNTDLGWVREHTRLLSKAEEWESAGRVANRMLAGSDIAVAKAWLERRPSGAPPPTELHRDYIAASEQAESDRLSAERRRAEALQRAYLRARAGLIAASVGALAAAAGGSYAFVKKLEAQRAEMHAASERDEALRVQSRHLTDISARLQQEGDAQTASLLALAGLPDFVDAPATAKSSRPYLAEVEAQLYASYMATRERMLLAGHEGRVLSLATSADGGRAVSGGEDQTARVWSLATGKEVNSIRASGGPVVSVAMSPDGARVAMASGSTVTIADADSGRTLLELKGHGGDILSVSRSTDGRRLVTGSDDQTARVWDAATGSLVARLVEHAAPVSSVALDAEGKLAMTGARDGLAILWDVPTAVPLLKLQGNSLSVTSVALSQDRTIIATAGADHAIRIWDGASGALRRTLPSLDGVASSLALDQHGKQLVVGSSDGLLLV
ncbi:MAG: toll/interleukin-1 receptor domain-containing protein, partial [Hyphomicrobiaceae bacterium]